MYVEGIFIGPVFYANFDTCPRNRLVHLLAMDEENRRRREKSAKRGIQAAPEVEDRGFRLGEKARRLRIARRTGEKKKA